VVECELSFFTGTRLVIGIRQGIPVSFGAPGPELQPSAMEMEVRISESFIVISRVISESFKPRRFRHQTQG